MLSLQLSGKKPLENRESYPYSKMAFDGCYIYCCLSQCGEICKLNLNGQIVACIKTKRPYSALCFDCVEGCFWALSSNCRNNVYKLSCSFFEIGSIRIPYCDMIFSDIAFCSSDDMLLLCGGNVIQKLSKSGVFIPSYSLEKSITAVCAAQLHKDFLVGCSFPPPCPSIIGVFPPNACFDFNTCTPKGFVLNSICIGYDVCGNTRLFLLATQNYQYSYMLEYAVCDPICQKECEEAPLECSHSQCCEAVNICANITI